MRRLAPDDNIVLIGMPGVGKSTVGVLLAKGLSRSFVDTDVLIQAHEGRRLQDILDAEGPEVFRGVEERHILALECRAHVIATGGSVVYSEAAMRHLRAGGVAVYLELPLPVLEERITNLDSRGVVMASTQTFAGLYEERRPLYERYADVTIHCRTLNHEQAVARIMASVGE